MRSTESLSFCLSEGPTIPFPQYETPPKPKTFHMIRKCVSSLEWDVCYLGFGGVVTMYYMPYTICSMYSMPHTKYSVLYIYIYHIPYRDPSVCGAVGGPIRRRLLHLSLDLLQSPHCLAALAGCLAAVRPGWTLGFDTKAEA